jgi:hypothetical protein
VSTPSRCTGVVAAAFTQGKRTQHGKPKCAIRDDQPDAREGQARRVGVAERSVIPMKPGNAGGGKEFPAALDREPRGRADYQLHRLGVAVLFHRDARPGRRGSAPRAAQAAGRSEPRGGRPPLGGGARRQVQGRAQRRLWRRPTRLRGRLAKSLGYRQQAHDSARRARPRWRRRPYRPKLRQ